MPSERSSPSSPTSDPVSPAITGDRPGHQIETGRSGSPLSAGSAAEVALAEVVGSIGGLNGAAAEAARERDARLTKPPGSLGRIESLAVQLAAIAGGSPAPSPEPAVVVVFAADHGVHAEGVSPWPQAVTAQMVTGICRGGAAISVITRANGLGVQVVNAGVAVPLDDHELLVNRPVRAGSRNLRREAALTRAEAATAALLGVEVGTRLVDERGARCLLTGDMGIANTTPSAAVVAAITGLAPADVTGRGTGIDDATLAAKTQVVADALARLAGRPPLEPLDPLGVLAEVGGLEIAGLAGLCLAGAAARVPVVVDGVIALAGALVACALQPAVAGYLIAGHRSVEPAAGRALDHLGLAPLLDLDLRLGEGTGAALAYPLVRAAALVAAEMATFDDLGIDA
ncbi:MAG: nicotinate-nucleotide--dimethylbenzimidazole phosphoribosyltransferase [Acidimicrobiales bacterium]